MIEASFDGRHFRRAAVRGAYQYDTGQRLRMHGLPAPWELAQRDEFLSGDMVTVQAQFGFEGDSQTQMRLAAYDGESGTWICDIPDEYMMRAEPVHVYLYMYYGETEDGGRARTMYEGIFTPSGRPAPSDTMTVDMQEQWETLSAEIDLAMQAVTEAAERANAAWENAAEATRTAQEAAGWAEEATQRTEEAGHALQEAILGAATGTAFEVQTLPAGSEASVAITQTNGVRRLTYGIPCGADGAQGEQGPTGPADLTITFVDGVLTITRRGQEE